MSKAKEKVKKRRSYFGFARYYPGRTGTRKYSIGDNEYERKREISRKLIIILLLILLFVCAFVVTTVCLNISGMNP